MSAAADPHVPSAAAARPRRACCAAMAPASLRQACALALCAALALSCAPRAAADGPVPCTLGGGGVSCVNGGVCMVDSVVGTYCHCPAGRVGTLCETVSTSNLTACADGNLVNYCANNGTCPATNTSYCNCSSVAITNRNTFRCAARIARPDRARSTRTTQPRTLFRTRD